MSDTVPLSQETREDLLRMSWLSHDARWYNAVADECGIKVANRANREAMRQASVVEARRLHSRLGLPPVRTVDDFFAFTEAGREVFVGPVVEMKLEKVDEQSYAVEVLRCFAAENISRAGLSDVYECGIFERIAGWHEGLGIPLAGEMPPTKCMLANGQVCTRTLHLQPAPAGSTAEQYTSTTKSAS